MSDAGYTLVETLTALAILALAIGGLTAGIQVLAQQQARAGAQARTAQDLRAAETAIDRLLEAQGPFRAHEPERLSGDGASLAVGCGREAPCALAVRTTAAGVELEIDDQAGIRSFQLDPRVRPASFSYVGTRGVYDRWPPAGPERQALRAVIVRTADPLARTLAVGRAWREHPAGCHFDTVLGDCR